MKSLGKIESIEEIFNFQLGNLAPMEGKNGAQLGMTSMMNTLFGGRSMDGYKVKTKTSEILVLIDNGQSCCEHWGYMQSEDDLGSFLGATLREIELTDVGCNTKMLEQASDMDGGGIQFVTFQTSKGSFQLAVYNAHNGYYGHGIIVAENGKILLDSTL